MIRNESASGVNAQSSFFERESPSRRSSAADVGAWEGELSAGQIRPAGHSGAGVDDAPTPPGSGEQAHGTGNDGNSMHSNDDYSDVASILDGYHTSGSDGAAPEATEGSQSGAGSLHDAPGGNAGEEPDYAASFNSASSLEQGALGGPGSHPSGEGAQAAGSQAGAAAGEEAAAPTQGRIARWAENNKTFGDNFDKALKPFTVPLTATAAVAGLIGGGLAINHYASGGV